MHIVRSADIPHIQDGGCICACTSMKQDNAGYCDKFEKFERGEKKEWGKK